MTLDEALDTLTYQERQVIDRMFGFSTGGCWLEQEVADEIGVSQQYVNKLKVRAMAKIREAMVGE